MMDEQISIEEIVSVFRRRLPWFAIPFILIIVVGIGYTLSVPAVYQSSATILIESQKIPEDLVRSTITSYAEERIQLIEQRVMTRAQLLAIADKFALFEDNPNLSPSQKVAILRQKADIEMVDTEVQNIFEETTTIAFIIHYFDSRPEKAFQVTNELVTLFLEENVRSRTLSAEEATEFIDEEVSNRDADLRRKEEVIAQFKQDNYTTLPELLRFHLVKLESTRSELSRAIRQIREAEQETRFLQIELDSRSRGGILADLRRAPTPLEQYTFLISELQILRARLQPDHPNIRALERQLSLMEPQVPGPILRRRLVALRDSFNEDREKLLETVLPTHPSVQALDVRIEDLDQRINSLPDELLTENEELALTDPSLAGLIGRLTAAQSGLEALKNQRVRLEAEIVELELRIEATPNTGRILDSLQREYDNSSREFKAIREKQLEAQLAEDLEQDQKAERFSLVDPPVQPDKPVRPNRQKMAALSFALAVAVGLALVILVENIWPRLRGTAHLARLIGEAPLGIIPNITTEKEQNGQRHMVTAAAASAPIIIVALAIIVHTQVLPLDLVVLKIMDRLG